MGMCVASTSKLAGNMPQGNDLSFRPSAEGHLKSGKGRTVDRLKERIKVPDSKADALSSRQVNHSKLWQQVTARKSTPLFKALCGQGVIAPSQEKEVIKIRTARANARREQGQFSRKVQKQKRGIKNGADTVRSLLLAPNDHKEDDLVLLTSCRKSGDRLVGDGRYKVVKYAVTIDSGERRIVAICSTKEKTIKELSWEAECFKMFQGDDEIVRFYFSYMAVDKCMFVFEDCDGGDLSDFIRENGDLPCNPDHELQIIHDIVIGVKKIHMKGLLHRDIKPENILLKNGRAKIADFGEACFKDDRKSRSEIRGSVTYFSPEVFEAFKNLKARRQQGYTSFNRKELLKNKKMTQDTVTEKADSWAVGVTLYEWISKHEFHRDEDNMDFSKSRIDAMIMSVPEKFRPLLEGLLQIDPGRRIDMGEAEKLLPQIEDETLPVIKHNLASKEGALIRSIRGPRSAKSFLNLLASCFRLPRRLKGTSN